MDEFLFFDDFAGPVGTALADGDPSLALAAGAAYWASPAPGVDLGAEVLVEVSLRPADAAAGGAVALVLRARNTSAAAAPAAAPAACKTSVLPDTNVCSSAAGEVNFVVAPSDPDPPGTCSAACCAAAATCGAWIVLPGTTFSAGNCSCSASAPCTCCWLKPTSCAGSQPYAGATAGFLLPPPGPPLPTAALAGYVVAANFSSSPPQLALLRSAGGGAAPALLGAFDLSSIPNGAVDGWHMLRLLARAEGGGGLRLDVYWNPRVEETGFIGNSSDASGRFTAPPPRISVVDAQPLPSAGAGLAVAAGGAAARLAYVSVLPASVA